MQDASLFSEKKFIHQNMSERTDTKAIYHYDCHLRGELSGRGRAVRKIICSLHI